MKTIIGVDKVELITGGFYLMVNYNNNAQTVFPRGCEIPYEVTAFMEKANAYPWNNTVFYRMD